MRIKVTFHTAPGDFIDINYQYSLASWIYNILTVSDNKIGSFWHDSGLSFSSTDNRKYKFFTFSNLHFPKYEQIGRKIYIKSDYVSFIFSTYIDKIGMCFVDGINKSKGFFAGKYFSVKQVEIISELEIYSGVILKSTSPVYVQNNSIHLSPFEHYNIYSEAIHRNLTSKYNVFYSSDKRDFMPTKIMLLSDPKPKTIAIKEGKQGETKLKCYLFSFSIKGDSQLIKIGYKCGFGQGNAMGFGCVDVVKPQNRSNDQTVK
ncbi:CRISPR-associated endoribonuclease Cas6 [Odoribacter sp. OF09-27XD]|nr:CRISPR-associated endoribonuclease Cas6 [Odoribacter sp. OF09-27XD]RHV89191.1 CRISPR-associated endoribonuclease Cas6 [Odoribacter sp. OF09-27XD]